MRTYFLLFAALFFSSTAFPQEKQGLSFVSGWSTASGRYSGYYLGGEYEFGRTGITLGGGYSRIFLDVREVDDFDPNNSNLWDKESNYFNSFSIYGRKELDLVKSLRVFFEFRYQSNHFWEKTRHYRRDWSHSSYCPDDPIDRLINKETESQGLYNSYGIGSGFLIGNTNGLNLEIGFTYMRTSFPKSNEPAVNTNINPYVESMSGSLNARIVLIIPFGSLKHINFDACDDDFEEEEYYYRPDGYELYEENEEDSVDDENL